MTEVHCEEKYKLTLTGQQADALIEYLSEKQIPTCEKSDLLLDIAVALNRVRRLKDEQEVTKWSY